MTYTISIATVKIGGIGSVFTFFVIFGSSVEELSPDIVLITCI